MADGSESYNLGAIATSSDAASDAASKAQVAQSTGSDASSAASVAMVKATAASSALALRKLDDMATPDDNTDLDASITKHGLAPKAPSDPVQWLGGLAATWADDPIASRRWCKINMNNTIRYDTCIAALSTSGSLINDDDDNSNFTQWRTTPINLGSGGFYSTTDNFVRPHHNPTFYCKFKTHSDLTNCRFFIGLNANQSDWAADPTSGNLIMLRYVSGTANFTYITKDGDTLHSEDSGVEVAASTVYVFRVVVSGDGATATFTINGANSHAETLNLPEDSTPLGFRAWIVSTENAYKYLSVSQVYVDGD